MLSPLSERDKELLHLLYFMLQLAVFSFFKPSAATHIHCDTDKVSNYTAGEVNMWV